MGYLIYRIQAVDATHASMSQQSIHHTPLGILRVLTNPSIRLNAGCV